MLIKALHKHNVIPNLIGNPVKQEKNSNTKYVPSWIPAQGRNDSNKHSLNKLQLYYNIDMFAMDIITDQFNPSNDH